MSKKDSRYDKRWNSFDDEDEWDENDYGRKRQKNGIREKRRDKYQKRDELFEDRDFSINLKNG